VPWQEKLLPLPAFLRGDANTSQIQANELRDGFALTGFFLTCHVLEPRGLTFSEARQSLISAITSPCVAAQGG
jgi:DNA repair protein RecO (recombination protein O)